MKKYEFSEAWLRHIVKPAFDGNVALAGINLHSLLDAASALQAENAELRAMVAKVQKRCMASHTVGSMYAMTEREEGQFKIATDILEIISEGTEDK